MLTSERPIGIADSHPAAQSARFRPACSSSVVIILRLFCSDHRALGGAPWNQRAARRSGKFLPESGRNWDPKQGRASGRCPSTAEGTGNQTGIREHEGGK